MIFKRFATTFSHTNDRAVSTVIHHFADNVDHCVNMNL